MSQPWTVRYRPQTTREIACNKVALEKIRQWLDSWAKGKPSKGAVLLYGPAGVGKTTVAEAVARERDWDLVEINASDKRSGEILSRIAGLASTQASLFSKGILSKEGVYADEEALRSIMERDRGDMRSAITDLQILTGPKKTLTVEDTAMLSNRDRTE